MTNRTLKWGEMLHLALMGIFGFTFGFWVDVPPKIAFFAPGLVFAQGVLLVVDSISDHNKLPECSIVMSCASRLKFQTVFGTLWPIFQRSIHLKNVSPKISRDSLYA